jgi:hypothetical protein
VINSAGTAGELQQIRVLKEYVSHFNPARAAPGDRAAHPGAKGAAAWDAQDKQGNRCPRVERAAPRLPLGCH